MRSLYFGGSFNPVHHGHLACARAVAERAGFDQITLVPNQQSPHKSEVADIAPVRERVKLCELAVAGDALFAVDDVETLRPPPSYTIDTVRELKRRGAAEIRWLIGADQVRALPQWHEADALMAETKFVVMARPGWTFDWSTLPVSFQSLRDCVVSAPLIEISSTDIRRRIQAGRSIRYLTPDPVVGQIHARGLYRTTGAMDSPRTLP